jgi:hypothetical protein
MLNVNLSAPRHLRSHLVRTLLPHTVAGAEEHTLYLLSPKQSGKAWRFAILYHGELVTIGKPLASREVGRKEGTARYGYKAQEIRGETMPKPKDKPTTATKPSYKKRVAKALAGEAAAKPVDNRSPRYLWGLCYVHI